MKQNSQTPKQPIDDFSVLSFSSTPNDAYQKSDSLKHQPSLNQGYCMIIAFVILGFYFIVFGIVELSANFNEVFYRIQLNRNGNQYSSDNTFISFKQNTTVLVYLENQHITQFDSAFTIQQQTQQCTYHKTNFDVRKIISINGTPLNPQDNAIPCGKHASFYPEGKFEIINTEENTSVQISTQDISFPNPSIPSSNLNPSSQWASFESERFRNWMAVDSNKNVKKLWGRISEVVSGNYKIKLTVNNEMSEVDKFSVVLNNNEALAGYNTELCYMNFVYAVMLFVAALANFLIQVIIEVMQSKWGHRKVLKKKQITSGQGNEIKIYLNSAATTPAVKFD